MANKLFGTDGVRGVANSYPMNIDFAIKLATILSREVCTNNKRVAIGKDTRISGDMLEAALTAGFTSNGIDVISLGVVPTPLVTRETTNLNVDMSLMITASHNPFHDNGIKLINSCGDKFPDEFYAKIENLLDKSNNEISATLLNISESAPSVGHIEKNESAINDYITSMIKIADGKSLSSISVVVDCANGAYYKIMPDVLRALGANVIAISNTPDGYNINMDCGTQHTESAAKKVIETKADFGISVDGDGDRITLIDNLGNVINGDQLLCFLAQYLKKYGLLRNNVVVSTEWSNLGLESYLVSNGINNAKSKVGERYVIDLMKDTGAVLGGELVGHIVLSDYAKTGDALATAIVLSLAFIESGKKMSDIFPIFEEYPCIIENIRFSKNEYMYESVEHDDVKQAVNLAKEKLGKDSNLIVRKSGTEPVIKLRVEAKDSLLVQQISSELKNLILKYQK